jgi:hypothetical protein
MKFLVQKKAIIAAADKVYFKHCGPVTSVIDDVRGRRVPR